MTKTPPLDALLTLVGLLAGVFPLVNPQLGGTAERDAALIARERPLPGVDLAIQTATDGNSATRTR